jgi:hypothetical protein
LSKKTQNQPKIELNDATVASCRIKSSEKSVQSWHRRLVVLPSLDHLICPVQHCLWNRQADLLRRLQINHQLKLITSSNFVGCSTGSSNESHSRSITIGTAARLPTGSKVTNSANSPVAPNTAIGLMIIWPVVTSTIKKLADAAQQVV